MGSFILRTPFNRSVPLAGSENIPVHSLCAKENWKGQKRRDASKGQNGRFRRKAGVRTFTQWLTLGPKNGRTFSLCTSSLWWSHLSKQFWDENKIKCCSEQTM